MGLDIVQELSLSLQVGCDNTRYSASFVSSMEELLMMITLADTRSRIL